MSKIKLALLNDLTFCSEQISKFNYINNEVDVRFSRWLINANYAIDEDLRGGLFMDINQTVDVQAKKAIDDIETQRKLLAIEKDKTFERERNKALLKEDSRQASLLLSNQTYIELKKYITNTPQIVKDLKLDIRINDLLSYLYGNKVSYDILSKLIASDRSLSDNFIAMTNDSTFCKTINRKPREITCLRAALGFVGIEGLKIIIPTLIIKKRINFSAELSLAGLKMWSFITTLSNTVRFLLKSNGHDNSNELEGYLLALSYSLGIITIYNQFGSAVAESRNELLKKLKAIPAKRHLYDAMLYAKPSQTILPQLFKEYGDSLALDLTDYFNVDTVPVLRSAITEQKLRKPVIDRNAHSIALKQGLHFSKFILLRKGRIFDNKHLKGHFYSAYIDEVTLNRLLKADLTNFNLLEYVA